MTDAIDELEQLHAAATWGTWRVHDSPRYWAELPDDLIEAHAAMTGALIAEFDRLRAMADDAKAKR